MKILVVKLSLNYRKKENIFHFFLIPFLKLHSSHFFLKCKMLIFLEYTPICNAK